MPDIIIVPANLQPGAKALTTTKRGTSGESLLAGDVVAKGTNGLIFKSDANDPTTGAPLATPLGIATCSTPGPNQTVLYTADDAELIIGGPTVPGHPYFLSANPGKICDAADLIAGMRTSLIGFGKLPVAGGPGVPASPGTFIVHIVPSGQTI